MFFDLRGFFFTMIMCFECEKPSRSLFAFWAQKFGKFCEWNKKNVILGQERVVKIEVVSGRQRHVQKVVVVSAHRQRGHTTSVSIHASVVHLTLLASRVDVVLMLFSLV